MTLSDYLPVATKVSSFPAGTLVLGPGGIVNGLSGIAGRNDALQKLILPVTAVADTDFTLSVPPGCTLLSAVVYTSTAYTGGTVTIQIGNAAAGAQYVAAFPIAAVGIVPLTLLAAQAPAFLSMPIGSPNLFVRIVQTTPTAVGSAVLVVNYST
jgi:hypothetical protein